MNVTVDLLAPNEGVRTSRPMTQCRGLAIHWIGVAQGHASVIRNNFARSDFGTHYISDWHTGEIIHCVPENEVCYHVGGKTYTETKEKLCGSSNPNWYLVGVECCIDPSDDIENDYWVAGKYMDLGKPSTAQYDNLVAFAADFLKRHGLDENDLYRHYDITGKICHVWFIKDESRWTKFKSDVAEAMKPAPKPAPVPEPEPEADVPSTWAKEAWEHAKEAGVFDGTDPQGALTREQCALVLDRLSLL